MKRGDGHFGSVRSFGVATAALFGDQVSAAAAMLGVLPVQGIKHTRPGRDIASHS